MDDDRTLLDQYTANGSRAALDALTRRYIGLVYSAARRQVRDAHLAEDVTQAVFVILSTKAKTIREGMAVGGWLLAVTRRTAVNAMQKVMSDRRHEEAAAKPERIATDATDWGQVAPELDEALATLGHRDRDAIVLRILENRSLAEVGSVLGISETGAHKCVGRALEKLRKILGLRGISLPAATLTGILASEAIRPVPAHVMAATITTLTTGKISASVTALVGGAMKGMAWATAKSWGAVAAICLLLITAAAAAMPMLSSSRLNPPAAQVPVASQVLGALPAPTGADAPAQLTPVADFTANQGRVRGMATGPDGTLFALVLHSTSDAGKPPSYGELRALSPGKTTWDVLLRQDLSFNDVLATAEGDLFLLDPAWNLYKRPAGQSEFVALSKGKMPDFDKVSLPKEFALTSSLRMTSDSQGNVYVAGMYGPYWCVARLAKGEGRLNFIDTYDPDPALVADVRKYGLDHIRRRTYGGDEQVAPINRASDIAIVEKGPAAGIYVVGRRSQFQEEDANGNRVYETRWLVRRSRDDGATWETVEDYLQDGKTLAEAFTVGSDLQGHVYVGGQSNFSWWMTKSSTGDKGTWEIIDRPGAAAPLHILVAPDGSLYAVGELYSGGKNYGEATVRSNQSGTWTTVGKVETTSDSIFEAATFDVAGNLYVGGGLLVEGKPMMYRIDVPHRTETVKLP